MIDKLCPLLLSGSNSVRSQALKLFQCLPDGDIRDRMDHLLRYARMGLTHISKDIKTFSLEFQSWLLRVAGDAVVSCAGGWRRTLDCLMVLLGWKDADLSKWSSGKTAYGADVKAIARVMQVLGELLRVGLEQLREATSGSGMATHFPLWHVELHQIPDKSNAYAYLNLFGPPQDDDHIMLEDRGSRLHVFEDYRSSITAGIEAVKKEGGELGRAAGFLTKALVYTQETI